MDNCSCPGCRVAGLTAGQGFGISWYTSIWLFTQWVRTGYCEMRLLGTACTPQQSYPDSPAKDGSFREITCQGNCGRVDFHIDRLKGLSKKPYALVSIAGRGRDGARPYPSLTFDGGIYPAIEVLGLVTT